MACCKFCLLSSLVLVLALLVAFRLHPHSYSFPISNIGRQAGYSIDQMPNLSGKVIIVTGATSGLGLSSTKFLAQKGAHVIAACRNVEKGEKIKRQLVEEFRVDPSLVRVMHLNLSSIESIESFAQEFKSLHLPLHVLLNNAGVLNFLYKETDDGFEGNIGVNYLGHVLLTNLLLDVLEASQPSRIVSVSSSAHRWGPLPWNLAENVTKTNEFLQQALKENPATTYGHSKLAQVLWSQELARRLEGKQIYVNSCNPGSVVTSIVTSGTTQLPEAEGDLVNFVMSILYHPLFAYNADEGSLTQLYLATSPEVEKKNIRGKFYEPIALEVPADSYPLKVQEDLWSWTENALKEAIKKQD